MKSQQKYYYGTDCFAGHCKVKMHDGSEKLAEQIIKGDLVSTSSEEGTKVLCVERYASHNGQAEFCTFENGLCITPGHPIMHEG